MTTIEIDEVETPIGTMELGVHDGALVLLRVEEQWGSGEHALARRFPDADVVSRRDPAGMTTAMQRYFDGDIHAIDDLAVDARGSAFQEAVWKAVRDVPGGESATYGEIARWIGNPAAVRAVGTAVGANPVGIVIPCHRILPASGGVGKYGGGEHRKAWLLAHEGVEV